MTTFVPVGSVLTRVYYAVPDLTDIGPTFDTLDDAAHEARRRKDTGQRAWIDERWEMTHPDRNAHERGGTTDLIVSRTEYAPPGKQEPAP